MEDDKPPLTLPVHYLKQLLLLAYGRGLATKIACGSLSPKDCVQCHFIQNSTVPFKLYTKL